MAEQYTHKPNSGSFFQNDRKSEESQPDYTGSAVIDGKEYWLSVWDRQSREGDKQYFGISFTRKD